MSNAATLQPWTQASAPRPRAGSTRATDITKALRNLRKATPEAVDLCVKTMKDASQDIELRIKIALKIIDAGMPQNARRFADDDTVTSITINIQRDTNASPAGITIDAEQPQTLTISTIPKGHGDD